MDRPIELAEVISAVGEYAATIDRVARLYHGSAQGLTRAKPVAEEQQVALEALLDSLSAAYAASPRTNPSSIDVDTPPPADGVPHDRRAASDSTFLTQLCLVMLFDYWEGEYRRRIARALGMKRKELTAPIMSDMELIRDDVIHRRGVVSTTTAGELQVIQGLQEGQHVAFAGDGFDDVLTSVRTYLDELVVSAGGDDPEFRGRRPQHG
jgi:hypothetical protein